MGSPRLKKTKVKPICANGQEVSLCGQFTCHVEYDGVKACGKVFVADVQDNLLGLDWFWKIKANRSLICPQNRDQFSSVSQPNSPVLSNSQTGISLTK